MDFYGFYTGQEFEAYKYLGAHYTCLLYTSDAADEL